ncbi:MAG: hypothetical protein FJ361_10480 [Gemmatimonadetes bacterium]|nr:hypothetical protein [Gemmatimonadota bacterium]
MIESVHTDADLESAAPVAPVTPAYMTKARAAAYCGVSASTFDRYIRPTARQVAWTPRTIRWLAADLDEAAKARKVDPPLG